ncbi:MAG: amidohydrolase family protein [Azoarcus sp.]|nr:amidohydrolase family protein [Azoarcus sp.]
MRSLHALVFWFCLSAASAAPPMLDAHSHYTAGNAEAVSPQEVIAALDAADVSHLVVSGTPWDAVLSLHEHAPERVIPLLGVYANHLGKAMWMHDADLPARVEARLAEGEWAGIGELHLFARDADSPVFAALVRMAADNDLMLLIHGDVAVIDRAFEIAPAVRVLWAHLGTVPTPGLVGRTIERHAKRALWVDTSVRDERIAPDGQLLPEWRALFEAHPQRFVVAVDTFSTNRWRNYGEVVASIRGWTADLSPELRERMLRRNAEALFEPWLRGRP